MFYVSPTRTSVTIKKRNTILDLQNNTPYPSPAPHVQWILTSQKITKPWFLFLISWVPPTWTGEVVPAIPPGHYFSVVKGRGNPRVTKALPVPLPINTRLSCLSWSGHGLRNKRTENRKQGCLLRHGHMCDMADIPFQPPSPLSFMPAWPLCGRLTTTQNLMYHCSTSSKTR